MRNVPNWVLDSYPTPPPRRSGAPRGGPRGRRRPSGWGATRGQRGRSGERVEIQAMKRPTLWLRNTKATTGTRTKTHLTGPLKKKPQEKQQCSVDNLIWKEKCLPSPGEHALGWDSGGGAHVGWTRRATPPLRWRTWPPPPPQRRRADAQRRTRARAARPPPPSGGQTRSDLRCDAAPFSLLPPPLEKAWRGSEPAKCLSRTPVNYKPRKEGSPL